MSNLYRRIELLANLAIIAVAIFIGIIFVQKYLRANPAPTHSALTVSMKVSLPGVYWAKNNRTLLLVMQKGCHFCTDSAPFYQRLVRETAGRGDIHLVAVLPQTTDESKKYLSDLGVNIEDIRQASLNSMSVRGTPTLILVDSKGAVTNSWQGELSPDQESEVLRQL